MSTDSDYYEWAILERYTKVLTNLMKLQMVIDPHSGPDEVDDVGYYASKVLHIKKELEQTQGNLKFLREELKKLKQEKQEESASK